MDEIPVMNLDIQGMPQNIYTQLLGAIACKLYTDGKIEISIKDIGDIRGSIIYVDGNNIIIKGFKSD